MKSFGGKKNQIIKKCQDFQLNPRIKEKLLALSPY